MSKENGPHEEATVARIDNRYVYRKGTGREVHSDEVVAVAVFDGPVARVRRGYGLTLNIGDYESARVDVSIEVPCYPEDVEAADDWASNFVEKRIEDEVAGVREYASNKKKDPSY